MADTDDWAMKRARKLLQYDATEHTEDVEALASALRDARREAYAARDVLWRETLVGMADAIQADSGDTYAAEMLRGAAKIVSDAIANGQQAEILALAAGGKAE